MSKDEKKLERWAKKKFGEYEPDLYHKLDIKCENFCFYTSLTFDDCMNLIVIDGEKITELINEEIVYFFEQHNLELPEEIDYRRYYEMNENEKNLKVLEDFISQHSNEEGIDNVKKALSSLLDYIQELELDSEDEEADEESQETEAQESEEQPEQEEAQENEPAQAEEASEPVETETQQEEVQAQEETPAQETAEPTQEVAPETEQQPEAQAVEEQQAPAAVDTGAADKENEILQLCGVNSLDELKTLVENAKSMNENYTKLAAKAICNDLKVLQNYQEDVIDILKGKNLDVTEDNVKAILERHPEWIDHGEGDIRIGNVDGKESPQEPTSRELARKMLGMD